MEGGVKNIKKLNNKTLVRETLQAAAENHARGVVLFLTSAVHVFTNNFITLKTERLFCFLFQGNRFPPLPSGRGITRNEGPSSTEHFGGFGRVEGDRKRGRQNERGNQGNWKETVSEREKNLKFQGQEGKKRSQRDKEKLKQKNSVKLPSGGWPEDIVKPERLPASFEAVCITAV